MGTITLRKSLWPALLAVVVLVVAGILLWRKFDWVAGILVPVVVAILTGWFVQRFPQLRRPVLVTAKLHDLDFLVTGDAWIPASGHTVRITVEAAGPLTVLVDGLRPVVVSRDQPAGDAVPHLGLVEPRMFEALLDHDPPILRPIPREDGKPAPDFPFKVSASDPEVFDIVALTETADVRWHLELDTVFLGRRRTVRIDLAGQPIRTMARPQATAKEGALIYAR